MLPTAFGCLVAALGLWCQFGPVRRTVVAMFALTVFGAASAVDLPALGGASVTPANFFLVFYLLRLAGTRGGLASLGDELGPRRPLFVFGLLVVWICGSAMLLPRLFDGATTVFSLSRAASNDGDAVPLHPTSGNLSQAVYAVGGFLVACSTAAFARRPGAAPAIVAAVVTLTALHLAFGALDLVTAATHTAFLLDVIHTASYAFLTDDELGGLKRISGSFSEASSFASFSLALLALNVALYVARVRTRFTGPASLALALAIVLATSSTGYVGLAAFGAGFALFAVWAAVARRRARPLAVGLGAAAAVVLAVIAVALFLPGIAAVAANVINDSLLNKAVSDSAIERGSWNARALAVFGETGWLGAGIGSTRASNYALVLLSNLGLPGFALFVALVARLTAGRLDSSLDREHRAVVGAARAAMATILVPSLIAGTVYDLGTLFYALAGVAASGAPLDVAGRRRADNRCLPAPPSMVRPMWAGGDA